MHEPAKPLTRRIGQLIRMLSSDQDGERAAAGQALNRTLASAGLDIHDLAKLAETGLRLPVSPEQPRRRPPTTTNKVRRPGGRPLAMDDILICDAPNGLFRPCGCGGLLFTALPGIGPHVAQLVCNACSRGGRWLGRAHFGGSA
jgi:hypothetical protein